MTPLFSSSISHHELRAVLVIILFWTVKYYIYLLLDIISDMISSRSYFSDTELLSVPFLNYQIPEKPAIQAIVCTPPNTMSAIREPFRYALYEGGELAINW